MLEPDIGAPAATPRARACGGRAGTAGGTATHVTTARAAGMSSGSLTAGALLRSGVAGSLIGFRCLLGLARLFPFRCLLSLSTLRRTGLLSGTGLIRSSAFCGCRLRMRRPLLPGLTRSLTREFLPSGVGFAAKRLARRCLARTAKPLCHIAVAILHVAPVGRVVGPCSVADLRAVELIVAVDIDVNAAPPP